MNKEKTITQEWGKKNKTILTGLWNRQKKRKIPKIKKKQRITNDSVYSFYWTMRWGLKTKENDFFFGKLFFLDNFPIIIKERLSRSYSVDCFLRDGKFSSI